MNATPEPADTFGLDPATNARLIAKLRTMPPALRDTILTTTK
jgi:hypothetical protein